MDAWVFWVILAVILAVGEIVSLSFFLAPFAVGRGRRRARSTPPASGRAASSPRSWRARCCCSRSCARSRGATSTCRPQLRTGTAALVGETAVVLDRISNDEDVGSVRLKGQVWTARTYGDDEEPIEPGQRVHVMEIRGATALVAEI